MNDTLDKLPVFATAGAVDQAFFTRIIWESPRVSERPPQMAKRTGACGTGTSGEAGRLTTRPTSLDSTCRHEQNKNMSSAATTTKTARDAVLDRLAELPDVISMHEFAPLIAAGYDQDELVRVLYTLQGEGRIEILMANGLRQIR